MCASFASPLSSILVEFDGWVGENLPSSCNCVGNDEVTRSTSMYFVDCENVEKVQDCGIVLIEHLASESVDACSYTNLGTTCNSEVSCEVGFRLSNPANNRVHCDVLGSWEELPTCEQVTCDWDAHVSNLVSTGCHGTHNGEVCDEFLVRRICISI
eukprot:TRINITY_DN7092_c0_g2_i1.p1 TRINITY_DN7092_c0_g2~~TRINITY_DN7092_c0_g2_i1.p1  ORF type:complete len:156 (+),score=18.96 TRINITY_DN7092_c0_g2_i1:681-1148(+)